MNTIRMRERLGLSPLAVAGLSLLAVPRIVAHDVGMDHQLAYSLMTFVPLAVWLGVVLWRRVPNPLATLTVIGVCYGVLLGVVHVALWNVSFGDSPPSLGGNLDGVLPAAVEAVVLRAFTVASSLVTGTAVGAALGVLAWLLARIVPGLGPGRPSREGVS